MSLKFLPISLIFICLIPMNVSTVTEVSKERDSFEVENDSSFSEDTCAGESGKGLVCKDPFGSYCFNSKCHCRQDYSVETGDGICLKNVSSLGEGCWVTKQCITPNSACSRSSGRILHDIFEPLWEVYVQSNGSNKYIPGKCTCHPDFKLQVVSIEQRLFGVPGSLSNSCIPRSIGSFCRTNYECASKARFARCQDKKCVCPSPEYELQVSTDECIAMRRAAECLQDNESATCIPGSKETGTPFSYFKWTDDVAGFVGFAISMTVVFCVWSVCCKLSNLSASDECDYSPGVNSSYSPGVNYFAEEDETGDDDDDDPPSYDDVVKKSSLKRQQLLDASFMNPDAVNNT